VSRVTSLTVSALVGAVVLAGCGGGGPRPGLGIEVAGHEVSGVEVDRVTADYCAALEQVNGEMGAIGLADLRRGVVEALALQTAIDGFLAAYADDPSVDQSAVDAAYAKRAQPLSTALASVDEELRESVAEVEGASLRAEALAEAGVGEEFDAWVSEQTTVVNPAYGVTVEDGRLVRSESLSVAVSDGAVEAEEAGASGEAAFAHAATLPDNQRCGGRG
jgi:hypothetical protein